ncbi:DUF4382 domain-containing protein [Cyclobacterium sp.]|uniref:DUF4382 domain-containing protein n=1 Tax=Cyclobacterium sp. TaxID=1966343 RepID=UPI00199F1F21|nr:DUF4382 domain-containing protein [Cyclobacterium sp.]MBD3626844.1 DUF4382 domain-containing protein [Cyclobacterium sp.]
MRKITHFILGIAIFSGLLMACDNAASENRSLVNILLVDTPGDFEQVWIEVLGVEILPAGSRGSAENASWINLPYQAASNMVRISDLVNEERLLIGRTEIQSGMVSKIKLLLGNELYLIQDETRIDLDKDSDFENKLEIDINVNALPGNSYDIYLDFDLASSVVRSSGGNYQLDPRIRAFESGVAAVIRGSILPRNVNSHVFIRSDTDTLTTLTGANGGFYLQGIPPNDYQITIDAPEIYQDTAFNVSVQADTLLTIPAITLRPQLP